LSADDITIFYVNNITPDVPNDLGRGAKAFAVFDSIFPNSADKPYTYNVVVGVNDMDRYTTAHELGHLLTNAGHVEVGPGGIIEARNSVLLRLEHNLMFGRVDFNLGYTRQINNDVYDSKRLWNTQIEVIRKDLHVK